MKNKFKNNVEFKAYLSKNKMDCMSKKEFYSNFDEEYEVNDDLILNGDMVFNKSNRIVECRKHIDGISTYKLIPLTIKDECPFDGCIAVIKNKIPSLENISLISQIPKWHGMIL